MPSEEFERHIKAKMDSHEHPPRPQVWEGIQAQLAKRRRSGIWIWWLTGGASALFLVIGLFTFNYFHQSGPKQTTLTQASNPYTNTSEFPISIEEKCPEEVPVGETIVSTQRPKRPTFNSTSLNLQISPFENNTNFDKEILGSTQLSKINPRKRIPSFTRKVLSIEMHPIAGQEWVLESDIHEILPTPQLLSIKFRPRLWVDISTTAEIAGTRIPKEPEELGNFFRALPYGPDFADIQGWDFVNPISPIGEISPVIKVTYPRIMQSVSASVAYQFRPRWSVDAGVRFLGSESGLVELGILPEASQEPVGEIVIAESRLESKETYRFSQRQLEIPVHVNLHLKSQGRHQLVLSAGPSLNANLVASDYFSSREAESALAREGDFPSYQSWNYHMDYGFRYEYFLGSHMKLHAGPQFKQQLTAAFSGRSAPEQMRFRLGLQAGLSWNLNR